MKCGTVGILEVHMRREFFITRQERVQLTLSKAERRRIDLLARLRGVSISRLIRELVLREAAHEGITSEGIVHEGVTSEGPRGE